MVFSYVCIFMTPNHIPLPPPPDQPLPLLAGLTPVQFMRRHWQKKPLLMRGAIPGFKPLLSRAQLFALVAQEQVESRLIVRKAGAGWTLKQGPFKKSAFPALKRPNWTLLVQGVNLHDDAAHALLQSFRFVPDARLDDLMISWASTGGGVGPHFDSYDVFLLQAQGRRRWRIGRQKNLSFEEGAPLKILRNFVAEEEYVLEPGDMLYLPPNWAHEGVAEGGECMTYSVGFRAPQRGALAGEIVGRLADDHADDVLYRDPQLAATQQPGRIPPELQAFAADAVRRLVERPREVACALGETMTEPKPGGAFDEPAAEWLPGAVVLDRRTRMMYDEHHVFINGESYRAAGKDASLMRRLADERCLDAQAVRRASVAARSLLSEWFSAGWLHSPTAREEIAPRS
jgi:50S ribosomal protein L16 3-hydroxylase